MSDVPSGISTDFMILCDSAQVQGNKLYVLGGGWSQITVRQFPAQHGLTVAAGILVPWMDTNVRHKFEIGVRTEDGDALAKAQGEFEQGRPPGLLPGSAQRFMVAVPLSIRVEKPCEAVAELLLEGAPSKTIPFRIVQKISR
jgi:hypothetical protein